jgi:hypothetical protein
VATPADALRQVAAPTLIVVGDRDSRGTSAASLAALLPHGQLVVVPGDHVTALAPRSSQQRFCSSSENPYGQTHRVSRDHTC